jgi:hypothetical protein
MHLRDHDQRVRWRTDKNNVRAQLDQITHDQRLRPADLAENRVSERRSKDKANSVSDKDERHDGVRDPVVQFHVRNQRSNHCNQLAYVPPSCSRATTYPNHSSHSQSKSSSNTKSSTSSSADCSTCASVPQHRLAWASAVCSSRAHSVSWASEPLSASCSLRYAILELNLAFSG